MTKEELEKENEIFKKANEIIAQQRDDRDADISKLENRIEKLEAQIEEMKCDLLSLIKDRMNDDIDQNIIERLAEKWEIKENG